MSGQQEPSVAEMIGKLPAELPAEQAERVEADARFLDLITEAMTAPIPEPYDNCGYLPPPHAHLIRNNIGGPV